jgi:hypothetical protein
VALLNHTGDVGVCFVDDGYHRRQAYQEKKFTYLPLLMQSLDSAQSISMPARLLRDYMLYLSPAFLFVALRNAFEQSDEFRKSGETDMLKCPHL